MGLRTRVQQAMKEAMRNREVARLSTLRLVSAAIKDRDIALRSRGGDASEGAGVSDADVLAILEKMVRQRHDSARAYEEGGRLELAERERAEIKFLEEFLPRRLGDDEVRSSIEAAIERTGATSIRDMGRVMADLKSRHAGQMDFSEVGPRVKSRLS